MLGGVSGPCPDDKDDEREETVEGVDAADMVEDEERSTCSIKVSGEMTRPCTEHHFPSTRGSHIIATYHLRGVPGQLVNRLLGCTRVVWSSLFGDERAWGNGGGIPIPVLVGANGAVRVYARSMRLLSSRETHSSRESVVGWKKKWFRSN